MCPDRRHICKHVKGLTNLEDPRRQDTQITDVELVHLQGMINLLQLDLDETQITDAGLVHLKELPELRELRLGYFQPDFGH